MSKCGELDSNFLYFSYGANIFTFLLRMSCPTAEFVSIARVNNYRLDFIRYSKFWSGPSSTMVPTANAHVWGVIWRLHYEDRIALDNMKEVEVKKYYINYVDALTPHMGELRCRTYVQKLNPLPRGDNDIVPIERWPSWTYKQVMLQGAIEHGLPEYYIKQIRKIKDNGDEGCLRMHHLLKRYAQGPPCECRVPERIPKKPLKLDLDIKGPKAR